MSNNINWFCLEGLKLGGQEIKLQVWLLGVLQFGQNQNIALFGLLKASLMNALHVMRKSANFSQKNRQIPIKWKGSQENVFSENCKAWLVFFSIISFPIVTVIRNISTVSIPKINDSHNSGAGVHHHPHLHHQICHHHWLPIDVI